MVVWLLYGSWYFFRIVLFVGRNIMFIELFSCICICVVRLVLVFVELGLE